MCDTFQMSIFIQYANVKEGVFCILQMLMIHTGLRKWNKNNVYHINLQKNNPIGIDQPCIKVANSEVLFEKYRMALKRNKDAIEIQKYDAIKRNRIFFDFMLRMLNNLNQLYEKEKSLLIDTILKYQSRNESAKKVKNQTDTIRPDTEIRKIHQSLLQKKNVLWTRQTKKVEQEVIPKNQI